MDVYQANLAGLVGLCVALYAVQQMQQQGKDSESGAVTTDANKNVGKDVGMAGSKVSSKPSIRAKKPLADAADSDFLLVYALVMAADWLQGPYLYSLYADVHRVAPSLVPVLFATGFVAGALSASVAGSAADLHGRKLACLVCCAAYAASCVLTVASPRLPLLLVGRALGGLSTSLLFSVFESWMVTDFWEREKFGPGGDGSSNSSSSSGASNDEDTVSDSDSTGARAVASKASGDTDASARLSHTFGVMGTVNSMAAIASGVFSEWVVETSGTQKAPFVASVVLLAAAFWLISTRWKENYGDVASKDHQHNSGGIMAVLSDPPVLVLCLASTLFEGSMYLFVFFWTPALQTAASAPASAASAARLTGPDLPFGLVFASFMAAAMSATLAFSLITTRFRNVRSAWLLLGLLGAAEVVFYVLSSSHGLSEQTVFWLFCLFEACVGTYWPCMGYLKGKLVADGARAQVYSLLRVPLNVFVVAALLLTPAGGAYATVFGACSTLLLLAVAGVAAMVLNEPNLP